MEQIELKDGENAEAGNLQQVERLYVYSVTQVCELAGCQRSTLYREAHKGNLLMRKLGRKTVILRTDLEDWLKNLPLAHFKNSDIDQPEGSIVCTPGEEMPAFRRQR